jgi:hypothetical protein
LPDAALAAVCEGRLSSWVANRVVAPLARANREHADQLVKALSIAPLSTRELRSWFEHYQKAGHIARERLASHPHLFVAVRERAFARRPGGQLRDRSATHQCVDPQRSQTIAGSVPTVPGAGDHCLPGSEEF